MEGLRGFFSRKATDRRFKKAGPGHRLADNADAEPAAAAAPQAASEPPQRDAPAALSAAAIAAEQRRKAAQSRGCNPVARAETHTEEEPEAASAGEAAPAEDGGEDVAPRLQVKVVCPLTGDVVREMDVRAHLSAVLLELLPSAPLDMSVKMVATLCSDRDAREACLSTLRKYLENLLSNPEDERFKAIRLGNKVFKDKIEPILGAKTFLHALGFKEVERDGEAFLALETVPEKEVLEAALQLLSSDQEVRCRLHRDPRVYKVGTSTAMAWRSDLPMDFYSLTLDDIRLLQKERSAQVDELLTLRTKAMREAQLNKGKRKYRFCLLRIRVNADFVLQGTFQVRDTLHQVYLFVREMLAEEQQLFALQAQHDRTRLEDSESLTLTAANLVPTAVLVLVPTPSPDGSLPQIQLKPPVVAQASDFTT